MMRHAAKQLKTADDQSYERLKRLAHGIGPAVIAPLAEALSAEQDSRPPPLRDILVEFGAAGASLPAAMNATGRSRRTAAFLLREFGGAEGPERAAAAPDRPGAARPREAIQALVLNGTDAAAQILVGALNSSTGRPRETLITELRRCATSAAPLFAARASDRSALYNVTSGPRGACHPAPTPRGARMLCL